MRHLRKYLALASDAREIVLGSFMLLPIVAVLLRLRGMAQTRALLGRLERRANGVRGSLAPREMARLVDAAASFLRAGCLPRSLVLWHLLRRTGDAAEIRFGVHVPRKGGLLAHAWVELDGQPVNDSADVVQRYAALPGRPDRYCAPGD